MDLGLAALVADDGSTALAAVGAVAVGALAIGAVVAERILGQIPGLPIFRSSEDTGGSKLGSLEDAYEGAVLLGEKRPFEEWVKAVSPKDVPRVEAVRAGIPFMTVDAAPWSAQEMKDSNCLPGPKGGTWLVLALHQIGLRGSDLGEDMGEDDGAPLVRAMLRHAGYDADAILPEDFSCLTDYIHKPRAPLTQEEVDWKNEIGRALGAKGEFKGNKPISSAKMYGSKKADWPPNHGKKLRDTKGELCWPPPDPLAVDLLVRLSGIDRTNKGDKGTVHAYVMAGDRRALKRLEYTEPLSHRIG